MNESGRVGSLLVPTQCGNSQKRNSKTYFVRPFGSILTWTYTQSSPDSVVIAFPSTAYYPPSPRRCSLRPPSGLGEWDVPQPVRYGVVDCSGISSGLLVFGSGGRVFVHLPEEVVLRMEGWCYPRMTMGRRRTLLRIPYAAFLGSGRNGSSRTNCRPSPKSSWSTGGNSRANRKLPDEQETPGRTVGGK